MMKARMLLGSALVILAGASLPAMAEEQEHKVVTASPDYWGTWGIDQTAIDPSRDPGDNFFMYVNGTWYDNFEIPADRVRYGAFDLLGEKSEQQVRFIIEDLAQEKPSVDTPAGKVAAFYNAFMDANAINAAGMAPAEPYLEAIAKIRNRKDLAKAFATPGYSSPIGAFVWVDDKDPNTYILQSGIGGLGMPDREYYLKEDDKSVELREQYVSLLTNMLEHAGYDDAGAWAQKVMALETEIAKDDWDRALSRNPEITYNKLSVKELRQMAGKFPIRTMLKEAGLSKAKDVLIAEIPPTPEELAKAKISDEEAAKLGAGFPAVLALANDADLATWKAYLAAHFLIDHASVLPSDVDEAVFSFYGTALRGQPEQRPRWKRAVSAVRGNLGEALGATYVERYFPPANKEAMDSLVANLRSAMAVNLENLSWMSPETRVRAEEKLNKFHPKVGYPKEFKTYDSMTVGTDALSNMLAGEAYAWEDNVSRLGKDVDKDEWFMTPQTVNAYYNPSFNEIVFPAAILQPPFFNVSADPAVNYGAIGAVIGHEMGHGFDDQGAKYNGDGVLSDWWTEADLEAFRKLGDALEAQYDGFCPLPEEDAPCVNGELTKGENIGDLGGLSLAYRAYHMSLGGEEAPVIDGLTGDQRFFMAWAQVWRSKYREEALRTQLLTDPHSPALYRVNGIVRNFGEWYDAFGVDADDDLYLAPEDRVRIW